MTILCLCLSFFLVSEGQGLTQPRLALNSDPPASVSPVLGPQEFSTTPHFFFFFEVQLKPRPSCVLGKHFTSYTLSVRYFTLPPRVPGVSHCVLGSMWREGEPWLTRATVGEPGTEGEQLPGVLWRPRP